MTRADAQGLTKHVAADAVLGVSLFGVSAPDNFQRFDKAFVSMFRIAGPARAATVTSRALCAPLQRAPAAR